MVTYKKSPAKNTGISKGKQSTAGAFVKKDSLKSNTEYVTSEGVWLISRLRSIGNSRGVILNSRLIEAAGLHAEADIMIVAGYGVITIQMKPAGVNTNLASWDKQFKAAIKKGGDPEGDLFEGIHNDFDLKEW